MTIRPSGIAALNFIEPCLPCISLLPPSGQDWLHEVKHDGLRLLVRRDASGVSLFNALGDDWTKKLPTIVEAVALLPAKSCIIDGEVAGVDADGKILPTQLRGDVSADDVDAKDLVGVTLHAFDLIEVNGFDVRRDPVEERKRALSKLLTRASASLRFNPSFDHEGEAVFRQACRMGFSGIVSKRRGSRYLSGRCAHWVFTKNLDS
jgi:bifunctional non-homologous end joining protein LigD